MESPATLRARPARVPSRAGDATPGIQRIATPGAARGGLLQVPEGWKPGVPNALAVMLHGCGGSPEDGLGLLEPHAESAGVIVLAPASHTYTWDGVIGGIVADPLALDAALLWVFERYAIDSRHVAVGGFSDGASYALTLALANGKLFSHGIALSPGFIPPPGTEEGWPLLFVAHGTADRVLPIDKCSRRIVSLLRGAGYEVDYREFEGGHEIPPSIARAGVQWFLRA